MKISIITATYNSAATVRDTLTCIAGQQYPNIEHIIVDGVSKDNTLAIVGEFSHIAKTISEKDKGIYDAMNKGVQLATGEVIGILSTRQTSAEGVVFAIKSKNIFRALDNLKKDSAGIHIKLPSVSTIRNTDRTQQVKKIEECVFMVKGY